MATPPRNKHEAITRAALGRPFQLGMLYDCRNDTLVTGLTLWDQDTIEANTHGQRMENSTVHLITGDDMSKKALSMGVNGEGQLSLMSGMVDVKGSAEFLMDTTSSKKQTRVSLHYQSISEFKEMDTGLPEQSQRWDILKLNVATHVVTGILYGADAVFVFDHATEDETTKINVQAQMEAAIKKLSGNLTGGGEMTHEQQTTSSNLSCKFYGDVILDKLPTTFSEARYAYDTVIEKINIGGVGDKKAKEKEKAKDEPEEADQESIDASKEDGNQKPIEKTVPKKVWMIPLSALDVNAPSVVREIDDITVSKVQSTFDQLQQLKVTATDLKEEYSFPPFSDHIQHQLDTFLSLVDARLMKLRTELKYLLPRLREDHNTNIDELYMRLNESMAAPFDFSTLSDWLEAKETEAGTLKSLFMQVFPNEDKNEGIEMAGTTGQFNSVLISPAWEYVLVVAFSTRQSTADSIDLSKAMADYLVDPSNVSTNEASQWRAIEKQKWYNDPSKVLKQKTIVQSFANFAEVNKENKKLKFAVTCSDGDGSAEDGPASIKLYTQSGNIDPENRIAIQIPSKPCKAEIAKSDEANSAILTWQKPEIGGDSVTSYTITLKQGTSRAEKEFIHAPADEHETLQITLSPLKKNRTYVAIIQAKSWKIDGVIHDIGLSEKHEIQFEFPIPTKSEEESRAHEEPRPLEESSEEG